MKTMMMLVFCVDQTILDECNRDPAAVCGGTVPNRRIFGC